MHTTCMNLALLPGPGHMMFGGQHVCAAHICRIVWIICISSSAWAAWAAWATPSCRFVPANVNIRNLKSACTWGPHTPVRIVLHATSSLNCVTRRRLNKLSDAQEPPQRAIQQSVEAEDNIRKQCGASGFKPNAISIVDYLCRAVKSQQP